MGAPQIIMVVLLAFSVSRGLLKHGESDGTVSAGANIFGVVVMALLLWWGGFWGARP